MPSGTLIRKIQRHEVYVLIMPPSGGRQDGATRAGQVR